MTPQKAAQEVIEKMDQLGRRMSPDDWIALCEEVASIADSKRDAAVEEQDDDIDW